MAVAWIAFVKQKGLSPLMPGQWKAFLAFYAGEFERVSGTMLCWSCAGRCHLAAHTHGHAAQELLPYCAGFWTIQNFIRPLRFALAVAMAPAFDGFMNFVQRRFQCRRQTAFAGQMLLTIGAPHQCIGSLLCTASRVCFESDSATLKHDLLSVQCTLHCSASPPPSLCSGASTCSPGPWRIPGCRRLPFDWTSAIR